MTSSLGFLVVSVLAATATELAKLETVGVRFLVLGCHIVAALAVTALEHNIIAWHELVPFPISECQLPIGLRQSAIGNLLTPKLP